MLSVTLRGGEALAARLDGLPGAVRAAIAAKSAGLADQLLALARRKAGGEVLRPRSGALAASICLGGPAVEGERVVTRIYSGGDLKYAAIQEYGGATSPHDILPSRAKALAFVAGGGEVFATIVHHPGSRIPERSYLRASLAEMAQVIDSQIKSAVLDAVARQMGGRG
jgi:phage gpG-like protein